MKRWTSVNKEIKKHLDEKAFLETVEPFRVEIQNTMVEHGEGYTVKMAFREIRARLVENARINLALLDAAAYEEDILIKKSIS